MFLEFKWIIGFVNKYYIVLLFCVKFCYIMILVLIVVGFYFCSFSEINVVLVMFKF